MNLISTEIRSLQVFYGIKQLIKAIPSINLAASSGGIVYYTSDSLMMYFRKDGFCECLSFSSVVAIDKGTVASLCIE